MEEGEGTTVSRIFHYTKPTVNPPKSPGAVMLREMLWKIDTTLAESVLNLLRNRKASIQWNITPTSFDYMCGKTMNIRIWLTRGGVVTFDITRDSIGISNENKITVFYPDEKCVYEDVLCVSDHMKIMNEEFSTTRDNLKDVFSKIHSSQTAIYYASICAIILTQADIGTWTEKISDTSHKHCVC